MKDFTKLPDLASERLGGQVLLANDEFFAPKENLLKTSRPVFIEDKYTDRGKWMDGWETRRRRSPGYDWCIVRLGLPGVLRAVVVDTSHFKGNFPEQCSLEACVFTTTPELDELSAESAPWTEILPRSSLKGDAQNVFSIADDRRFTHLRLKIYPDGGVARLRVYGEVTPDWTQLVNQCGEIDLAAVAAGARVVASSDEFFSSPQNLLLPGKAPHMGEGWETRRRRGPGHDWVIISLGIAGVIHGLRVDTSHFKGNFPESCSLEACDAEGIDAQNLAAAPLGWKEILARSSLGADRVHVFENELQSAGPVTYVRFNIFPDGGVSRLRILGVPTQWVAGLEKLNSMGEQQACAALMQCCGSTSWAHSLAEKRPFANVRNLFDTANRVCDALEQRDWLEAFSHHPKIGEKKTPSSQGRAAQNWSEQEQSGVRDAAADIRAALEQANDAYHKRFGYIFIVCATGKSSREMLGLLQQRLGNDPEAELQIAAAEQRRIMQLRLGKLLGQ